MLAARWHGRGDVRLDEVPAPGPPGPGELLLRVEATGICGTDIEEWLHGPLNVPLDPHPLSGRRAPLTLGHETVGEVIAAGTATTIPTGTRVAVEANRSCGRCRNCRTDHPQQCPLLCSKGLSDDGGLAELMTAPEAMCVAVPSGIGPLTAVLAEPLAVAVHALTRAQITPGDTVAVLGGGTIGQLAAQVARAWDARPLLVEPLTHRRELAASYMIATVPPGEAASAVAALTDGCGADACIESSGARGAVAGAAQLTRRGGQIVVVGISREPIAITPFDLVIGEQTITASLSHQMTDFTAAIGLLADGQISTERLITDVVPLADIMTGGFAALRDQPASHLKVVAVPGHAPPAPSPGRRS